MHLPYILVALLLFLSCCHPPSPTGNYYGRLKIDNYTYRLYLNLSNSTLMTVGFRGNEIPLDTLYFKNDTLHFARKDFYSEFNGYYDNRIKTIIGQWIAEDSISHPLTFVPVLADTIIGLHSRTTREYKYQVPPQLQDDIEVCGLERQGMRLAPLDSLVREIVDEKYKFVHSMLVARNNCLVLEEYFYGFKRAAHFGIQSATKSFVSALTGIALAKGEIKNVRASLCEYLPNYQDLACNTQTKASPWIRC